MKSSVIVESVHAQFLRKFLQHKGYWDETRKLKRIENGKVAIPVILENETEIENLKLIITKTLNSKQPAETPEFQIDNVLLPPSKKSQIQTPHDKLLKVLENLLEVNQIDFNDDLKMDVPSHWEVHGDLVLFPEKCFKCQIWKNLEPGLWKGIAAVFDCNKVAQKFVVSRDGFRSPQVTLLHGEDGWIHQVDNGLRFTYDVTKCMYSSGNITEKLRIAKFNCEEETVVDLYAGIGYFTIPYLVHAKAKHVHACEWNPDAVEALNKNLQLNNVSDKCTIHYEDNRKVCPTGIADRVNLGLIPSSEPGWSVACVALNPVTGGILHIHNNVTSSGYGQELGHLTAFSETGQGGVSGQKVDQSALFLQSWQDGVSNHELGQNVTVFESGQDGVSVQELSQGDDLVKEWGNGVEQTEKCQSRQIANMKGKLDERIDRKITTVNNGENNICTECDKIKQETSNSGISLSKRDAWTQWACTVSDSINSLLHQIHKKKWTTNILHIEHVKSYAPHIDHLVLDLECRPDI